MGGGVEGEEIGDFGGLGGVVDVGKGRMEDEE